MNSEEFFGAAPIAKQPWVHVEGSHSSQNSDVVFSTGNAQSHTADELSKKRLMLISENIRAGFSPQSCSIRLPKPKNRSCDDLTDLGGWACGWFFPQQHFEKFLLPAAQQSSVPPDSSAAKERAALHTNKKRFWWCGFASAYVCSKGVEVGPWRGVEELVVELLLPDEPPCLRRTYMSHCRSAHFNLKSESLPSDQISARSRSAEDCLWRNTPPRCAAGSTRRDCEAKP